MSHLPNVWNEENYSQSENQSMSIFSLNSSEYAVSSTLEQVKYF
jgi:hypothetical protein